MALDSAQIISKTIARTDKYHVPGIGRWPMTWTIVAGPNDEFVRAVDQCVLEDTPENRKIVVDKANAYVEAWAHAASEYKKYLKKDTGPRWTRS